MDFGTIMGGQNPYAGQDTGFGDSIRNLLMKQFGGQQPTGNIGAVDPAQAAYTGAVAPDFGQQQQPIAFSPNGEMGGMQGATPAGSAGIPQPAGMPAMTAPDPQPSRMFVPGIIPHQPHHQMQDGRQPTLPFTPHIMRSGRQPGLADDLIGMGGMGGGQATPQNLSMMLNLMRNR